MLKIFAVIFVFASGCSSCHLLPKCRQWKSERKWHEGYTTYMVVDDIVFPIEQSGYWSDDWTCVEREFRR